MMPIAPMLIAVDRIETSAYVPRLGSGAARQFVLRACQARNGAMKVRNSLKSAKLRDKNCRVVRRKGRVYVINKTNPRFKARQG